MLSMNKKVFFIWTFIVCTITIVHGQNPAIVQYINTYKYLAIREMERTGVPASIKLAQGILETQAGASNLVKRSNNHFGIKCKTAWSGSRVYHDDDERGECFRAYGSAEDSYRDHSDFLKNSQRYAFLFDIDPLDYKEWAKGLKKAGYATNPKYTQQLIRYVEDYDLQLYSLVALGRKTLDEEPALYADAETPSTNPVLNPGPAKPGLKNDEPEITVQPLRLRYPANEPFKINDTKVIVALEGTSLLVIADQYAIRYKHLLDFNEIYETDDIIRKDQLLFLQRKRRQGAQPVHVVRKGESLYDVAQEEGIRLDHLLAYNQLQRNALLTPGQRLALQKDVAAGIIADNRNHKEVVLTDTVNPEPSVNTDKSHSRQLVQHIVQKKETLFGISRKYDVTVEQIRVWNQLKGDMIHSGQELLIYKN